MSALIQHEEPLRRFSVAEAGELSKRFQGSPARDTLAWAMETFEDRFFLASSFSAEDIVLIDIAASIDSDVRVVTLDTGRLHQETYDTIARVRERLGIRVEMMFPEAGAIERFVAEQGPNSFYEASGSRRECCRIRKVEPLRRALRSVDAWATGMRRAQSVTRTALNIVEMDFINGGLLKLNPLADWSREQVWSWIRDHDLPYNHLHDRGFPSIGCAPCTRAVKPGEDERAGRWWWERPDDKECGLHK